MKYLDTLDAYKIMMFTVISQQDLSYVDIYEAGVYYIMDTLSVVSGMWVYVCFGGEEMMVTHALLRDG